MIKIPQSIFPNIETKTVRMTWDKRSESIMPDGDYFIRGGVCWPIETNDHTGDRYAEGHVVLAAKDCRTDIVYIISSRRFRCIDHVIRNGRMEFEGVSPWFNLMWSMYYATHFFWRSDMLSHRAYSKEIRESKIINPRPHFIEVEWKDDSVPMSQLWMLLQSDRMKYPKESELYEDVQKQKDNHIPAGVRALMSVITGYALYPWRKK